MRVPPPIGTSTGPKLNTNLLFFTKRTWYYGLSDIKTCKTKPFVLTHLDDFVERLPQRHTEAGTSEQSWWVDRAAIEAKNFDLEAVNPNRKGVQDTHTPAELLDVIEAKGNEVAAAVAKLRALLAEQV